MAETRVRLHVAPITLADAQAYIRAHHRHHGAPVGHRLSVSVVDDDGILHGVAILGRPVSRVLAASGYIEVTRVATDGTPDVCSMLYGAARRIARAWGYAPHKIITYTLAAEPGTSLHAAGWVRDGRTAGGTWDRAGRRRVDTHPTGPKIRWTAGRTPGGGT